MRKRLSDCHGTNGCEGGHLEKAYLLLDMRDLGNLIDRVKRAKHGEGPPPPPPPRNPKGKNKGKGKMDDLSGVKKDNEENIETLDGRSTPAQNELVLRLEQKILELQGELEQVQNLENLSFTLNVPDINQQIPITQNQTPPQNTQNQNPPPNPPTPYQYPAPPQNLSPPPVPTPQQHYHHTTQYPQTTTYHIPQNAPQPTPDPQNSTNDHPYTQISGVQDMDCSVIVEEEKDPTIQTVEKGVVLKNWTATPFRARRVPG
nr:WASH complex subunit 3-like [Nicotiana tomentosiformis]